jgi:polysaccharide biosynthesis protein PslH
MVAFETPLPAHGGSRLRMLHLARQLARRVDLDVAALGPVPDAPEEPFALTSVPHDVSRRRALLTSWRRPYLAARYDSPAMASLVASGEWDVVQITSAWLVPAARAAGVPVVLDAHNVEEEIVRSLAATETRPLHRLRWYWEASKTARAEAAAVAAVDAVLACSQLDADRFHTLGARRVVVVPNGVDCSGISHALPPDDHELLYVGQLGYRPNEAAVIQLIDEVLPLVRRAVPDARLRIVGREPGDAVRRRAGPFVEVVGEVPEVMPYLRAARVLVVPLLAGSGTRLKILEAMAAGIPVVTTAVGAAGLDATPGRHLLIGDTPAELAEHAADVLTDGHLARSLSESARLLVESCYDWPVVAQPMLDLHADLTGR